jgi:hypothetical protein
MRAFIRFLLFALFLSKTICAVNSLPWIIGSNDDDLLILSHGNQTIRKFDIDLSRVFRNISSAVVGINLFVDAPNQIPLNVTHTTVMVHGIPADDYFREFTTPFLPLTFTVNLESITIPDQELQGHIRVTVVAADGTTTTYIRRWQTYDFTYLELQLNTVTEDLITLDAPLPFGNYNRREFNASTYVDVVNPNNNNNNYNQLLVGERVLVKTSWHQLLQVIGYGFRREPGFYLRDTSYGRYWTISLPKEIAEIIRQAKKVTMKRGIGYCVLTLGGHLVIWVEDNSQNPPLHLIQGFRFVDTWDYDGEGRLFLYKAVADVNGQATTLAGLSIERTTNYKFKLSIKPVVSIYYHILALSSGGQVYCWGDNNLNQCGLSLESYVTAPKLINIANSNGESVVIKDILATSHGSVFLAANGHDIYVLGDNGESGQMYLGLPKSGIVTVPTKLELPSDVNIREFIYPDNNYSDMVAAYTTNNQVLAFGLGINSSERGALPTLITPMGTNDKVYGFINTFNSTCYLVRLSAGGNTLKCFRNLYLDHFPNAPNRFVSYLEPVTIF